MSQPRNLQATAKLRVTELFESRFSVKLVPATVGVGDDPNGMIVRSDTSHDLGEWR